MIGQDILVNKILTLTLDTLPRSLIFIGDTGSGRHTLFNLIQVQLNIPSLDITDKITKDIIDEIYLKVEPIIYLIDLDNISVKEENMILKLVEEPLKNAYIIFIAKAKTTIIPTILNRCQIWELAPYSNEDLIKITGAPIELLDFCNTPGQLIYLQCLGYNVNEIKDFCNKIIDYISGARFSNTLTISNKIAFNNEDGKWNYDIFVKILQRTIKDRINQDTNVKLFYAYEIVNQLYRNSQIAHITKQHLFENCLYTLKQILR